MEMVDFPSTDDATGVCVDKITLKLERNHPAGKWMAQKVLAGGKKVQFHRPLHLTSISCHSALRVMSSKVDFPRILKNFMKITIFET
jgi:tRNA A37 threonylcarbamoyltransferase TsaD